MASRSIDSPSVPDRMPHTKPKTPFAEPDTAEDWNRDERTDLMSMADLLAAESLSRRSPDGESVTADFHLGGAVPRQEIESRAYQTSDIYVRLENTIYGPVSQARLIELLSSGALTGFESASSDLRTWTPLIYHPRMTLGSQIDPDATHRMLHQQTDLPSVGRPVVKVDLEKLGEEGDAGFLPQPPGTPLAAILIKPMKAERKGGPLPIPVHANLDTEKLEDVIKRTDTEPAGAKANPSPKAAKSASPTAAPASAAGPAASAAPGDTDPKFPSRSAFADFEAEYEAAIGARIGDTDEIPAAEFDGGASSSPPRESESDKSKASRTVSFSYDLGAGSEPAAANPPPPLAHLSTDDVPDVGELKPDTDENQPNLAAFDEWLSGSSPATTGDAKVVADALPPDLNVKEDRLAKVFTVVFFVLALAAIGWVAYVFMSEPPTYPAQQQ